MSSNDEEPSSWMSSVGITPSLGVTVSTTVAECCNGVMAWWYSSIGVDSSTTGSSNANEEEETLAEPLVVAEHSAQVMEDRISNVEQESDLFLEEHSEQDEVQSNLSANSVADIEHGLVTPNSESIHSPTNVFADEICDSETQTIKVAETIESDQVADIENPLLKDSASVCPDEPQQEAAQATLQIKQVPFQDELQETQSFLYMDKNSSQPLDIENALAAIDDDEECVDSIDQEVTKSSSIFRSSTPEPGDDDQDTETIESSESIQMEQDTFEDEHQIATLPARSNVKKRVSDLIGIFESLSMDEEENNVTPTSLCSSSSFTGAKSSAQDSSSCPCCNHKIYPTDATIAYHDKLFHGGCFKCHLCDRKFSRGLSEVAGLVTKDDGETSILTCTKCRDDAAVKHLPLRKSTPACQPITVTSPEKGNIQQVKDEIGDDLESVMDGMIPRCTICGIHFLGSGDGSDMMIVGMNKYHRKCRMYGRPMVERSERKVLPIVAANYAPESLVVRLCNTRSVDDNDDQQQPPQEVMTTLYFILPDKTADLQRIRSADRPNENVSFEYTMDSSAYANPNYEGVKKNPKTTFPCHGAGLADSSLSVGFLGDPFGLPIRLANTRITEDRETGALLFCAELECFKFQLRHCFELVMHKKGGMVDLKTATLSMNIR